jgi:hypothetical protein
MGFCCSNSDCRETDQRKNPATGAWEAWIDHKTFPSPDSEAPEEGAWRKIPDNVWAIPDTLGLPRPMRGIVCFYHGYIRCADKPLTQG